MRVSRRGGKVGVDGRQVGAGRAQGADEGGGIVLGKGRVDVAGHRRADAECRFLQTLKDMWDPPYGSGSSVAGVGSVFVIAVGPASR